MADEEVIKTGVNDVQAVPPSASEQPQAATPPSGEQPEATKADEGRIPRPRFNEVIQERNEERIRREALELRIRDMEARLSAVPEKVDDGSDEVKRLVKNLNMSEEAARELMEVTRIANEKANAPLRAAQQAQELASWNREMAKRYDDYDAVVPEMEKVFSSLPKHMQGAVVSPAGLEMLYHQAKARGVADTTKKAYEKGQEEAYAKKAMKQAVSSTPGQGSKGPDSDISIEWIKNASVADYKKNINRVNHWLSTGKQL